MKLVVDANILFSALIKESTTRWLLFHLDAELVVPEFIFEEIKKYQPVIMKKAKLQEQEFLSLLQTIKQRLIILSDDVTVGRLEEARAVMKEIDEKDSAFLAAALASGANLWSDDAHFQKQQKVKVWRTKDLVSFL